MAFRIKKPIHLNCLPCASSPIIKHPTALLLHWFSACAFCSSLTLHCTMCAAGQPLIPMECHRTCCSSHRGKSHCWFKRTSPAAVSFFTCLAHKLLKTVLLSERHLPLQHCLNLTGKNKWERKTILFRTSFRSFPRLFYVNEVAG